MKKVFAVLMVLMMITGGAALAMPVRSSTDPVTVTAVPVSGDGEETSLELTAFHLLGTDESGNWIVFVDGQFYSVNPSSTPIADVGDLPDISTFETVQKGSKGEAAKSVQQALIDAGYLDGTADGDFGKKSEEAVQAFQAANGLEQVGVADPLIQMLIKSMGESEIEFNPNEYVSPYEALSEKVGIDLQALLDTGMDLDYDEMKGELFISDGLEMSFDQSGESDLEKYIVTVQFGLNVMIGENGSVEKKPAVKIGCLSMQRPVITEITVKSGNYRGTNPVEGITIVLDGIEIREGGMATLTENMVEALNTAAENGELKVRVGGQYKTFDIQVGKERLEGLSKLGQMMKGL